MQREFATRVKKKSFIIMTIAMPFLMAALAIVPALLAMVGGEQQTIALIDNTGQYAPAFKDTEKYKFVATDKMSKSLRSDSTDIEAVVQISGDLVDFPNAAAIYSRKEVPRELRDYVANILTNEVRKEKLIRYHIPELNKIVDDMQKEVSVSTIKWTDDGSEQETMAELTSIIGMALTLLIYMFVLAYGGMVMQSVIEEKTNRIVELMVSSIRPIQLMMGKIIGIGLVGIFQMLIWGAMMSIILSVVGVIAGIPLAADMAGTPDTTDALAAADDVDLHSIMSLIFSLPIAEIAILFFLYFIGGYLLYASILAAFGAAINEPEDSQQFMLPVMGLMIFAFYAGFYSAENPDGPLAMWCSFIPLTSPIVMMVRIPYGVPVWQELLSVALLYATALGILYISAKIYRVGILMYGKKPSYKEMMKWIKYK